MYIRVMAFPYSKHAMPTFPCSSSSSSTSLTRSSSRCFLPSHPTWSHIIKQLYSKLIPSERLVFHTFQFKAITHSGLLLQGGLCQLLIAAPRPFKQPPALPIPRVSAVTRRLTTSISTHIFFFLFQTLSKLRYIPLFQKFPSPHPPSQFLQLLLHVNLYVES